MGNETFMKVKCLKLDNTCEYINGEFVNFYAEHTIRILKTVPKMPHQNGMVERMNQKLSSGTSD